MTAEETETRTMRISEFAKHFGVSAGTVRSLEKRGLLVPNKDWAGHRRFTAEHVEKMRALLQGERA